MSAADPRLRATAGRARSARRQVRALLPQGAQLPEPLWRRWDGILRAVLWLHLPALAAVGLALGVDVPHLAPEIATLAVLAAASHLPTGRVPRSCLTSLGLLSCSATLVHVSGGVVEMHFHFFVTVGLIALYQDWRPYLLAFAFVFVHHGVIGTLDPARIYNHPAAQAQPVRWAALHAIFLLAASGVQLMFWRANEEARGKYLAARHDALHDPLTGLANRRAADDRLDHAFSGLDRDPGSVAVLLLDLDGFKAVNDRLGHGAGDELLVAVARRLRACVRPGDLLARLGGDEFTVVLERLEDPDDARRVAFRILRALEEPVTVAGQRVHVSASIGVAGHTPGTGDARRLLRAADAAMYRAKQTGGRRVERARVGSAVGVGGSQRLTLPD